MKEDLKERKDGKKRELLFILVFFVLAVGCIVLGILCLEGLNRPFIDRYFILFSVLYAALIGTLCGVAVWFTLTQKETLTKTALSAFVFLIFCLLIMFILQKTGFSEVFRDSEKLQAYLEKAGVWMPIFYIVLQFLQVVILPIPSVVSTVAGVTLFGAFWTMIYSLIGILLGSFTAFFIGRKLGAKAVSWMVGKETLVKWQKKIKGKDNLILTLMFLLPLFPDDVLCFLAGLSSMSTRYFILMIIICRFLGIAGTCYSIDFIPFNTWWGILLWGLFLAAIIALFLLVYKNMDRIQSFIKNYKQKRRKKRDKNDNR